MTDPNLKELKGIRWVADAVKIKNGYAVLTKPNSINIELTYKICAGVSYREYSFAPAGKLKEPIMVYAPQYWMYLYRGDGLDLFSISLAKKPKDRGMEIGIIPQYHFTRMFKDWGNEFYPCYGNNTDDSSSLVTYRAAEKWRDKANEVAIYLQSAASHYSYTWYRTAWAYRLGLVGDEMRTDVTPAEAIT